MSRSLGWLPSVLPTVSRRILPRMLNIVYRCLTARLVRPKVRIAPQSPFEVQASSMTLFSMVILRPNESIPFIPTLDSRLCRTTLANAVWFGPLSEYFIRIPAPFSVQFVPEKPHPIPELTEVLDQGDVADLVREILRLLAVGVDDRSDSPRRSVFPSTRMLRPPRQPFGSAAMGGRIPDPGGQSNSRGVHVLYVVV